MAALTGSLQVACARCAVPAAASGAQPRQFAAPRALCHNAPPHRSLAAQPLRLSTRLAAAAQDPAAALAETAALDELIDSLLAARGAEDLAMRVGDNIMSFDQRFWLRVATRSDSAGSEEEKEALAALAKVVMQLVDAMVKQTNAQLDQSASLLQDILTAAADPGTGEWTLPLPADKVAAMGAVMDANPGGLDEALLSNCYAWMRKASEENMEGMLVLLQRVLQLYAARALGARAPAGAGVSDSFVCDVLREDEALWTRLIRQGAQEGGLSEPAFMEALQRRMEAVVLGMASGSYGQRVQAEYLKELEGRAKAVFADLAAGL